MKYEIKGGNLPVVVCQLEAGETMITERGAMSWMSPNISMDTNSGGLGKAFGRMFSGESMFQNRYTATGGNGMIAFSSSYPGSIMALEITPEKGMVAQKGAFLACEEGVNLSVHFNGKVGSALFGGEGFIMQKLSGRGTAFVEIDGSTVVYELGPGQQMIVDTGYLALMDETVSIEVKQVPGLKNMVFGGEGIFNTVLTGPGRIYLQTQPIVQFVNLIRRFLPSK